LEKEAENGGGFENASSEVDMDDRRLSGGGGGIVVGPLFAGEGDSKLRGLPNVGAALALNDGVTRLAWSSDSGV